MFEIKRTAFNADEFERMLFVCKARSNKSRDPFASVVHVEWTRTGSRLVATDGRRLHITEVKSRIPRGDYKPVITKESVAFGGPVEGIVFPNWKNIISEAVVHKGTLNIEIPCRNWSPLNQFITFIAGTRYARGIRQWNKAGRKVKKGAHAFYIFVPMLCPQRPETVRGMEERRLMPDTAGKAEAYDKAAKTLTGFKLMPVFAVEDTEGGPLDYEERFKALDVEALPLIDVAKSLGVTVQAGLIFDGCAGSFHPVKNRITMGTADSQVFLHELSHAVDNTLPGKSEDYAFNEVVAELSAAFLGSLYGVKVDIDNTKAYINGWSGKGHAAFKVTDALERVERIYRHIRGIKRKPKKRDFPAARRIKDGRSLPA
jgi:hypothetical protein